MSKLKAALSATSQTMNEELARLLDPLDGPENRLVEAMRYAALDGGKRLRPFLAMQTAQLFGVAREAAARVAAAIEMIHCYSLIHDDLPAMDDDDLRRGRPSCHRAFDEATAILAGDALLTKAFEVLAGPSTHSDPQVRCELIWEMAAAAGSHGMVGGQMLDLLAEEMEMDVAAVTRLQNLKTGRLFSYACQAGAILGKAPMPQRQALKAYAHDLGLAFQIADDILDVEGDPKTVGKTLRKDDKSGKATFVSLLGVDRARAQAEMLVGQAIDHLSHFDEKADLLRETARFVIGRKA